MNFSKAFRFARVMQQQGGYSPMKLLALVYHSPKFFKLFYRLMNDPRVPFHLKALCWGSILYLLSPIDLLKDFMIGLGHIDDIVILFLAFRNLVRNSPPDVVREHVQNISEGR